MARAWLIDSRGLAKKVRNAGLPDACQIDDYGANTQCPNCEYIIDNSDISPDWPGLPSGVKFDPSDVELLDHLAAKCGMGGIDPHAFIDEFIPTLEGDEGICYTHPENLPGAKKNGISVHFFYRIKSAYKSGQRKRRKIQDQDSTMNRHVRWHKTGKTRPVMENGVIKGFKKIMVLYVTLKKGSKPDKCNWVMHQYHLGVDEEEREGDFVVSKIFYQLQKETDKNDQTSKAEKEGSSSHLKNENTSLENIESYMRKFGENPNTPNTNESHRPWSNNSPLANWFSNDCFAPLIQEAELLNSPAQPSWGSLLEDQMEDYHISPAQPPAQHSYGPLWEDEMEFDHNSPPHPSCGSLLEDEMDYKFLFDGECATVVDLGEKDTRTPFHGENDNKHASYGSPSSAQVGPEISGAAYQTDNQEFPCALSDLEDLNLDTPPDFELNELQFASQDSIFDLLERV